MLQEKNDLRRKEKRLKELEKDFNTQTIMLADGWVDNLGYLRPD